MIVVTGATGNIGRKLSEILLKKGQKVRALARTKDKLKELEKQGAEIVAVSMEDTGALAAALKGADAVFAMIPPSYNAKDFRAYQRKIGEGLTQAIKTAGVTHVVNLSSLGADRPDKLGPISGLHEHEQRLNKLSGINVLHLRPTYFMENHLGSIGVIKNMGVNGSPLKPDLTFPMIATQDIAAEAAERLTKRDFKGTSVKELLGPRDLTMADVTRVLGKAIGKPELSYVQFSYEDAEKAMRGMGMSDDAARLMVEMVRGFNDGLLKTTQGRSAATTTRTTIDEFAATFAGAYKSAGN